MPVVNNVKVTRAIPDRCKTIILSWLLPFDLDGILLGPTGYTIKTLFSDINRLISSLVQNTIIKVFCHKHVIVRRQKANESFRWVLCLSKYMYVSILVLAQEFYLTISLVVAWIKTVSRDDKCYTFWVMITVFGMNISISNTALLQVLSIFGLNLW